jgi:protein arginine kinase
VIESGAPLANEGSDWIRGDGHEGEVVLSTRVRVARNLQGFTFPVRASADQRAEVLVRVRAAASASECLGDAHLWEIEDLDEGERNLLLERHLVSRELVGAEGLPAAGGGALILSTSEPIGLMVNEEDHLRMQALAAGFHLEETWRRIDRLDEEIGHLLPYAFHHEFGFLTSCPTNVGTGLRASVLIHLPGLVLTKEISKVLEGISQVGLTYRGLHGEGSEVVGNFFQISNQTTLGKSEEELIDHLARIAGKVIEYEKSARSVLLREAPAVLEDKVWRAYGILRTARSLSVEEMMNLLSGVRLGLSLKLLHSPRVETLNEILVLGQAAHLERAAGGRLDEGEADVCRATFVRDTLAADDGGISAMKTRQQRKS